MQACAPVLGCTPGAGQQLPEGGDAEGTRRQNRTLAPGSRSAPGAVPASARAPSQWLSSQPPELPLPCWSGVGVRGTLVRRRWG